MIIIAVLTFGVSIAQTNVVQEGYYEMIDEAGNVFDTKASEREVIQGIYNYYLNTGKKATYRSPNLRIDFDDDFFSRVHSDTVFIDTEQVRIVNSIVFQNDSISVSDIQFFDEIVTDTVTVTPCFEDYSNPKSWFHVGDTDNYPHRIWFPTKEYEFIGLMFSDSLTTEEKATKTSFVIERSINRLSGNTSYKYLPSLQE